jgi:hypothetical protein
VLTVSTALATFLNDRFSPRDCDDSPLLAGDSPARTEIAEVGSHLAQGLFRLVELVNGRLVYMTSGPWLDAYDGSSKIPGGQSR